jgi:type VI secretion system protein VasD
MQQASLGRLAGWKMVSRRMLGAGLACVLLALAACASKPPKPAETTATILASADVNPDSSGRPSPVVIRIYQLRGNAEFNGADFFALYDKEKETLGAALILRDEVEVFPGQPQELKLKISPDTQFVGAIAAYRDVQSTHWRAVIGTPEKSLLKILSKNRITIHVDKGTITLSANG